MVSRYLIAGFVLATASAMALSGCAPVRFGSPYDQPKPQSGRNPDDNGPRPPAIGRAKGIIKKGETSGRKGNDTYVCGDPKCETAIRTN